MYTKSNNFCKIFRSPSTVIDFNISIVFICLYIGGTRQGVGVVGGGGEGRRSG